ncbi:hypothetical protein GGI25_005536 [Coemansia spiralis]|uniref:3-hydroxyisobutyrate dehydrogenase n=2 Tax=Coemansia TaxID=4863 RepID=A0A9W8G4J6_9FUNG|nr:NAD binding domain of 6-phosphogluconate dehydrogenase-domain-containing protein [Coemansia spiralis]KAJ1989532.1 hypothetical protein EDC05_004650 [Coemansia umbellata]KAJ2623841.1 hypothetical protein GGI26_002079 [Coemansia sp. RSA 1358]KAJ2671377.1 hypothetical protein GGI25_005536 [Coemansia spiralis]
MALYTALSQLKQLCKTPTARSLIKPVTNTHSAVLGISPFSTAASKGETAIGFIGLGQMGFYMAKHLQAKANKPFIIYDVDSSAISRFTDDIGPSASTSIKVASSPADLASQVSVIVTALPESSHVKSAYLGSDGIIKGITKGTLCIDSSTIDTSVSIDVSQKVIATGARAVDAPISGGIMGAKAATLTFMVGSENTKDYKRAKAYLEKMGKNVVHCGNLGAGQAAKICNNMLLAISMIGTAEAMNLGMRLGLDPSVLASIFNTSSGRCWSSDTANPVPNVIPTAPSTNGYNGGFKSRLMLKDLGLVSNAAKDSKTPLMLGALAENIYRHVSNNPDMIDKDFSVVYQWLASTRSPAAAADKGDKK